MFAIALFNVAILMVVSAGFTAWKMERRWSQQASIRQALKASLSSN
jgi:hypothetical protein